MLTVILQMRMKASDMRNIKYIYPYVFMTDNEDDLDNKQTMKMIWTTTMIQTTTTKRMIERNMLTVILQTMMLASDMSNIKYTYPYVFMTDNEDDLDKKQTTEMIWTMTTIQATTTKRMIARNMLTAILQMMMTASSMSNIKKFYLLYFLFSYVFLSLDIILIYVKVGLLVSLVVWLHCTKWQIELIHITHGIIDVRCLIIHPIVQNLLILFNEEVM